MEIVNLTPHDLTVVRDGEVILSVEPSGQLARCVQKITLSDPVNIEGVLVPGGYNTFGEISGLPERAEGKLFFVSILVAKAAWEIGRDDVIAPLSTVKDDNGKIIGASGLAFMPR